MDCFLTHLVCWEGANEFLHWQLCPRTGGLKPWVVKDCGPNQAKRNRLGQGSKVTAWQRGKLWAPWGKSTFSVPQRHCRTSVTLRDIVKRGKIKPWKNLSFALKLGQSSVHQCGGREQVSSPKAALSVALPPLLPDSSWQPGQVSAKDTKDPKSL